MLKLPAPPRRTILGLSIIALAILGWGVFRGLELIAASLQGKSVLISRGVMFSYDSEITINDHNFTIRGPPELSFLQEVGLSPAPIAAVDARGFKLSPEEWKRVCKIPSLQVLLVHGSNIQFVDLQHLRARSRIEILGVSGT